MGKTGKKSGDDLKTLELLGIKLTGWRLAALSAFGVAVLAFTGDAALEVGKNWNSVQNEQIKAASDAAKNYDALDDIPRLAGVYIATGMEGSPSDVRKVARFLRTVLNDVKNQRYTAELLRQNFGGRLQFWKNRFLELSSGLSPVSNQFTANEHRTFALVATDLRNIIASDSAIIDIQTGDAAVDAHYASPDEIRQYEEASKARGAIHR